MRILLANPRGFCAGVHMAVDVVDQLLTLCNPPTSPPRPAEAGVPIYVYHEIVHNKHVVQRFVDRGAIFVEHLEEVPEGSILVFSAHGVSPAIRQIAKDRNLTAVDATCPLVTKVHSEAIRYARQGYQILLIGHADHQEVVGTRGEAPHATQVVESPDDIPHLHIIDPDKLVYLTQTTLSTDDAAIIIDALKAAFPNIKEPPGSDICYATTNRQHAVRQIAPECDAVLVVGSKNSSNSVRLTEISRNVGVPAYLLDDVRELRDEWFAATPKDADAGFTVLITAGASAPEDLVAEICKTIISRYGGSLQQRDVVPEDVEFALPATLKRLMREHGIDPDGRKIQVGLREITEADYGITPLPSVPLTVGGRTV